tara:strand:- start:568 stop:738 length:171 start_codon:yes stop_codon:yes gene_type:complete
MDNDLELLLGTIGICFAAVVVYFAFKSERTRSSELMKELKSIKEILKNINDKMSKL